MVKKHLKELTIVLGLIVALLIGNYVCLTTVQPEVAAPARPTAVKQQPYVPMFTELVILSTKIVLKPLDR